MRKLYVNFVMFLVVVLMSGCVQLPKPKVSNEAGKILLYTEEGSVSIRTGVIVYLGEKEKFGQNSDGTFNRVDFVSVKNDVLPVTPNINHQINLYTMTGIWPLTTKAHRKFHITLKSHEEKCFLVGATNDGLMWWTDGIANKLDVYYRELTDKVECAKRFKQYYLDLDKEK